MDFSYVHIRYFIGYVYHICLQDTIQSTLSLCLLCQAMLLPMPLRPLLLTTRSGFNTGSELAPGLNEKRVAASAFHSPPQLHAGDQVGDLSQRKSYSQLASGQTMYTRTEVTTCSMASHFHVYTRVKGPACHQRVKKKKKVAILSNGRQDKKEMG